MKLAIIDAYALPDGCRIERCPQRNGDSLWAVRLASYCLTLTGGWEYEPMPSSRTPEFLANCRFPSPEQAYATWEQTLDIKQESPPEPSLMNFSYTP